MASPLKQQMNISCLDVLRDVEPPLENKKLHGSLYFPIRGINFTVCHPSFSLS